MRSHEIDELDRRLLRTLQRDGRITNLRLAEEIGLSPSACLARHRRLEQAGVITGYHAAIAAEKLRPQIKVILQIRLARHSTRDFREIGQILKDDDRVIEAAEISGGMDYHAALVLGDMEQLRDFIDRLTERAPVIEAVTSFIVLHATKERTAHPI